MATMLPALPTALPAEAPDEAERVRLAARTSATRDLERLACDPATTVRAAVALNPAFAEAADMRLAQDEDERVRSLLAAKMARLLPGLATPETAAAQAHIHAMLRRLAQDAAVRVRKTLADTLTKTDRAPKDVILTLAHDPVLAVSRPVLRLSPLLTDADLLDLLASPPHLETAVSIAGRPGLGDAVADEIARHADSAAVAALLANQSAAIREATLDSLCGRAGDHPEWHEPLISRPALPLRCMRVLSLIVARTLMEALLARPDIPPELAAEVESRMAERFQPEPAPDQVAEAQALKRSGTLTEAALLRIASSGDAALAAAMLAVASDVPPALVERAVGLRSAKALVSLVHRAGFSMQAACAVQDALGRFAPGERLDAAEDGSFPLSSGEMEWQIELLSQPGQ